jgi:hypothetical protein
LKECVVDDPKLFDLLADIQVILTAYRFIVERKIIHNNDEMEALKTWAPGVHKTITEDAINHMIYDADTKIESFEITAEEKTDSNAKTRATVGMSSGPEQSRREPEFSAFDDEMKRLEQTGFLAD